MLREVVFDTETTGIDHAGGDRVVEFGGIELLNHIPTGRHFHAYVNPERLVDPAAFAVHGLSDEFLAAIRRSGAWRTSSTTSSATRGSSPTTRRSTSAS